ncbi:MAG TPA: lysine--tRNA ligase [Candidatus Kaiserbacteria bacterium]|nr:lysine--tRNA ligase [Candidatus Kaiserbacteria bacterium]
MAFIDIRNERIKKLEKLKEKGVDAYPSASARTHTIQKFLEEHTTLEERGGAVTLDGRVMSVRTHGGSLFLDIYDGTGRTQGYLKKDEVGEEVFSFFEEVVDIGDIVELSGMAFTTKRGAQSLLAHSWKMLAKSLRPIPDTWFGIKDEEERYRKRYLDILLSEDLRARFHRRSLFWNTIRAYLLDRDFMEVETPVLETTTGGADARPFVTHHNALNIDAYLRISAGELWQKRLMVAGFPKVFEIGRIFRNEGMSFEHAQDYTQVEFYQAFSDYEEGMDMITDLYRTVADKVYNTLTFSIKEFTVNFDSVWERYDYGALIKKEFGVDPFETSVEDVRKVLEERHMPFESKGFNLERGVDTLWKHIRKTLSGPGFLIGVPVYMEPLAKRNKKDLRVADRFQVILAGSEMGKGFSELNNSLEQAQRFNHQQELRDAGDDEAQMNDTSYVEALEYGMPPTFGFGVSERLFSFLEGVSVREGQLFPLLRPKQ